MRKILMIGPNRGVQGGMSSVINTYYESELAKNNKIYYLATYDDRGLFFTLGYFFISLLKLPFFLIDPSIRIVHIHSASKGSFYRKSILVLLSHLFRKKVMLHIHGARFHIFYECSNRFMQRYIKWIISKTYVIALSESWKKDLKHMLKDNAIKVSVLYNPVALPDNLIKEKTSNINIVFLGRLGERKGTYDLIDAMTLVKSKKYTLFLGGDGDVDKVKNTILNRGLSHSVKIVGWVKDKEKDDLLRNADIYILPSYNEGLPISILEAMAYGLPVISTPVGGIPEAIIDGCNGFLVQPGDVVNIASKLEVLIKNKALRDKMGKEGRKIAEEKFDITKITQKLEKIYAYLEK